MTRTAFLALLSHWRRQPIQLVTLVLGLALATGLWSAVQAINAEARASYARASAQLGVGQNQVLTAADGHIPLATYVTLRRAGWQLAPVLEGRMRLGDTNVTIVGVDLLSYPAFPVDAGATPDLSAADIIGRPGRLFAETDTVFDIGTHDTLPPMILSDQVPHGIVMTDIGTAEHLLNQAGHISRILVLDQQPVGLSLLSELAPDLILDQPDTENDTAKLTDSFHLNLTAFGLLSFAVGLFIVHGTVGLAFQQRRGMFRTLRALGLPLRRLTVLLLVELLVLALISGALGLIIGYLVAAALLPDVVATLRGLYGAPITGGLTLQPLWFASGLGMALAGAMVAGAQGIWQLHRLPLLAAPGMQAWLSATTGRMRLMTFSGLGLIALGIICVLLFDGLIAGFVLLAGLMLGAAVLLPPALSVVLGWAANRSTGVVANWVWADLRAQLPGLSLALMALLLALATNVGVGTMVSSFRLTFTGWLDQRLASELYITARSDAQSAEMQLWLRDHSDMVLPIRYAETRLLDQPTRVYGVVDHSTYRDNWPILSSLPDHWEQVAAGTAVLINEQLARRQALRPGDRIAMTPDWTAQIAGIYSDYGNPGGQAIVGMDALLNHYSGVENRQFGIRVSPERAPDLAADLRRNFDLPARAIVDQASIKALSLGIFEKTFVITGTLNVLTLGVASFAIFTSLLTLWTLRLPQLAPVWALGMTRRQLGWLELARSLALAALTAILALPLGLAMAWVLLTIINVEAFGWRLPMYVFPWDWLRLGALALLAGAVAAALPARRLQKTPPADLLKVFANER